jgi:chemotaxis signal transduction protein
MAIYLQVRAGPVQLLLDALAVHEVLSLEKTASGAGAHCEWRDQVLAGLNLAEFLGFSSPAPGMGVVFGSTEAELPVMLQVDEVVRLRNLSPTDWHPLPHVPVATRAYFDAVFLDSDGQTQIYRLIKGLDLGSARPAHPINP